MPRGPRKRAPYRMVAEATWELARADYLGGMTAQQVADKYVIGVHNLRAQISKRGWSKSALAAARVFPGPGGPPLPHPAAAAPPAPDRRRTKTPPPQPPPEGAAGGDLLDTVLERARAALTAGRGAEATALLKAMREYVLVRQDVEDARNEHRAAFEEWDRTHPSEAGALDQPVTLQSLYARWCGLSDAEQLMRMDPGDDVLAALDQLAPGWRERGRKKR